MAAIYRRADRQVFYSIREAAKQLRVPPSAIARVFEVLKAKGILHAVRGSRTMLEGSGQAAKATIKAFIALPVYHSYFMALHDYRQFHLDFWKESKHRGFVSHPIFFEDHPQGLEELKKALEEYFDFIVWFLMRPPFREIALRLSDRGIRQIRIANGDVPGIRSRYEIRRENALATILSTWQRDAKVRALRIIRATKYSAAEERMIEQTADDLGLEYEHIQVRTDTLPRAVASLCCDTAKGIILPGAPAMLLSVVAPRAFAKLLKTCLVALPDGPVTSFFEPVSPAPVDLITVDWPSVAKRIVADLITKRAFDETQSAVFEAVPQLRVPAQH